MLSVHLVLVVMMMICFVMGFLGRPSTPPLSWGWLGMFFFALDMLVKGGG